MAPSALLTVSQRELTQITLAQAALQAGQPRQALALAQQAGQTGLSLSAVAALRLGELEVARAALNALPLNARRLALQARCAALSSDAAASDLAWQARKLARQEGDAPALVAAVTLLGELNLAEPYAALKLLAEGLKVAEIAAAPADAHLLAVLAHAQLEVGGRPKAERTATKALARAAASSPAQVWALLALGQAHKAEQQRRRGELDKRWLAALHLTQSS